MPAPATAVPLPRPPTATPLELCWIETARVDVGGELATEGATKLPRWHATASALLVRHPQGDVLIDTGSTPSLRADTRSLRPGSRAYIRAGAGRMRWRGDVPAQLERIGLPARELDAIVLSHVHPDHAGGVAMLPGVPVKLPAQELAFVHAKRNARDHHVLPRQAAAVLAGAQPLALDRGPFGSFDAHADLFGDGSVVVVPLFGHTPGSVGIAVQAGELRVLHVGDVVLVRESLARRVPKGRLMQPTDVDRRRNAEVVAALADLQAADPRLVVLPAHDRDAWRGIFGETSPERPACIRR